MTRGVSHESSDNRDEGEEFRRQDPKNLVTDWMVVIIMELNITTLCGWVNGDDAI